MNADISHSSDCPCLNIGPFSVFDQFNKLFDSNITLEVDSDYIWPIPPDYGYSCEQHDLKYRRSCEDPEFRRLPDYCYAKWCYVDKDKCFQSNHTYFEERDVPGLYYSYSTCSTLVPFDALSSTRLNTLHGADVAVAIPEISFPYTFKRERNNTYPRFNYTDFQGAIIEYLDTIRIEQSIKSLSYKMGSNGSIKRKTSIYTAAVNDVSVGLADIGGGVFWITAQRLDLTPFTVPLFSSPLYLYELKKPTDLSSAIQNTLRPFSNLLWLIVVICVIMVGIFNFIFSSARSDSEWYRLIHGNRWKSSSRHKRGILALRAFASSTIKSFVEYFSGSSETEEESTVSHKVLVAGFGFFILIIYNTYTATLASFLTVNQLGGYVRSFDDAVKSHLKICAMTALKPLIENIWPQLKDDNDIMVYVNNLSDYYFISWAGRMLKTGQCDVFVADSTDFNFIPENEQDGFCEMQIVSVKAPVMNLQKAMPIQTKLQGDFSKAMLDTNVDFESFLENYASPPLECDLYLDTKAIGNAQLSIEQMFFPILILCACILIGTCFKIITLCNGSDLVRRKKIPVEKPEFNEENEVSDNHSLEDFNIDEIDELDYKFLLDRISLNTQKLQQIYSNHIENRHDGKQHSE